jgi:hypothetical protein
MNHRYCSKNRLNSAIMPRTNQPIPLGIGWLVLNGCVLDGNQPSHMTVNINQAG